MGELCEVLELIQAARGRFTTVRAVVSEWRHLARSARALERAERRRLGEWSEASRLGAAVTGAGEPPPGADQTSVTRLWWRKPDRVRLEREEPGSRHGGWVEVAVGDRWWGYHPDWGAVSNEGDPEMRSGGQHAPFPELFEPSLHIPALDLELAGRAQQAGREGLIVRGRPRELDPNLFTPVLPRGADAHELLVDAEVGILLRRTSFVDGEPFAVTAIEEIALDEPLPPETFVFVAPVGLEIRPADEVFRSLPPGLGPDMEPPSTVH